MTFSKRSVLAVSIFISKHQLPHHGAFIFCHFGPSTSSITRPHVPIKHPLCYKFQSTGRLCFSIESRRYSLPLFHSNPFCNCISFLSAYPLPTTGWQHLSSFRLHSSLLDIVSILLSLGITLIWIRLLYLHLFNPYFRLATVLPNACLEIPSLCSYFLNLVKSIYSLVVIFLSSSASVMFHLQ